MLAGASMGAHTLLRFALDAPERVAGLVVVTPGLRPGRRPRGFARWDALADGLRAGGVDGFVEAYGDAAGARGVAATRSAACCASGWPRTSTPTRSPTRCRRCRARARSSRGTSSRAIDVPTVVVASRDEADPGHPYAVGERYADAIPGAELRLEEPGAARRWPGRAASSRR